MSSGVLLVALVWTMTSVVVCDGHQKSSTSVPSLLEKEGFDAHCVSRALAQCQRDIKSQEASAANIHLSKEIQQLSNTSKPLLNAVEALPLQALTQALQNLSLILPATPETSRPRDIDGGGWTVVQRRDDLPPYEDFYRTWIEYERGFGDLRGQFWLGLDILHHLTSHSLQELRFDLADFDNTSRWAKYGFFHVGDSDTKYIMHCGRFTGDAGDSLAVHSGQKFSTHDQDNDVDGSGYYVQTFKGGWWYKSCHSSNLNGEYLKGKTDSKGVIWYKWKNSHYSLRQVEMKIRPTRRQ